jgi:hypothetical protein
MNHSEPLLTTRVNTFLILYQIHSNTSSICSISPVAFPADAKYCSPLMTTTSPFTFPSIFKSHGSSQAFDSIIDTHYPYKFLRFLQMPAGLPLIPV